MDTMTPVSLPLPDVLIGAIIRLVELLSGKHTGLRKWFRALFPESMGNWLQKRKELSLEKGRGSAMFCSMPLQCPSTSAWHACLPQGPQSLAMVMEVGLESRDRQPNENLHSKLCCLQLACCLETF